LGSCLSAALRLRRVERRKRPLLATSHGSDALAASSRRYAHLVLWQPFSQEGMAVTPVLAFVVALSLGAFSLSTCEELLQLQPALLDLLREVELGSTLVFTGEYLLRVWAAAEQPTEILSGSPWGRRLVFISLDLFSIIDLLSILPLYVELLLPELDLPMMGWIRILRLFHLLTLSSLAPDITAVCAAAVRQLDSMILVSCYLGLAVWISCAALYHYFEQENPAMVICPACQDVDHPSSCASSLEAASCYNRLQSIPSAMYFCLVNLFGEFPLSGRHKGPSRCVCTFVALVGQVLMGIPCGLLGGVFQKEAEKKLQLREGRQVSEASAECALPLAEAPSRRAETAKVAEQLQVLNGITGQMWESPLGPLDLGSTYASLMTALTTASILYVAVGSEESAQAALPEPIWLLLQVSHAGCGLLCAAEYAIRTAAQRRGLAPGYGRSCLGLADLISFLPVLLLNVGSMPVFTDVAQAAMIVARAVKLERFFRGFRIFRRLARDHKNMFLATALVAAVLWIVCSSLMYIIERQNPNQAMRKYYSSVPAAMWITLLNLSGECPLVDYTIGGRWLIALMGLLAVGLFTVPFGLLSGGFEAYLEDEEEDDASPMWLLASGSGPVLAVSVPADPGKLKILEMLCGSTGPAPPSLQAVVFERVSMCMTFLSVAVTLIASVESAAGSTLWKVDSFVEQATVCFFTLEFCLRLYTAPVNPDFWSRRRYLLSASGLIDILTVGPYYLSMCQTSSCSLLCDLAKLAGEHDEELRLLRVLRLALLDNYIPSVRLVRAVLRRPCVVHDLSVASYVGAVIWLASSCLLWLTERWDPDSEEQRGRFRSLLSSAPFALVHLTGDYPLIDYTLPAKAVNCVMIVLTSGFVSVPAGILANGFKKQMAETRKLSRMGAVSAPKVAPAAPLSAPTTRTTTLPAPTTSRSASAAAKLLTGAKSQLRRLRMGFSVVSVAAVLLASMPFCRGAPVLHAVEVLSTTFFTLDYLLHLLAAPASQELGASRLAFITSSVGLVDAASILPFWAEQALFLAGRPTAHLEIFLV
ncbi:unnamed protein product, partial [Polarella glacialis]